MTEWEATGLVVGVGPVGEIDAIVTVVVEAHGLQRGFVRAGRSRRARSVWEVGNRVWLRWRSRDADGLGTISGEVVDQPFCRLIDDGPNLAGLQSACAVIRDALPLGGTAPLSIENVQLLIGAAGAGSPILPQLVTWEIDLLSELGYGLDLRRPSGTTDIPTLVSPRTGRAVAVSEAGAWRDRLLPLPAFLREGAAPPLGPDAFEIQQGFSLTGHFLAREAFAHRNRRLPPERERLYAIVCRLAERNMGEPQSARTHDIRPGRAPTGGDGTPARPLDG